MGKWQAFNKAQHIELINSAKSSFPIEGVFPSLSEDVYPALPEDTTPPIFSKRTSNRLFDF
jgi:hypothetical protein